jgi:hypothetical protein
MDKATGLLRTINNITSGLKEYLRFTFILSKNWIILLFNTALTACAMINEWMYKGELLHSFIFLITLTVVIIYTIITYSQSKE